MNPAVIFREENSRYEEPDDESFCILFFLLFSGLLLRRGLFLLQKTNLSDRRSKGLRKRNENVEPVFAIAADTGFFILTEKGENNHDHYLKERRQ